MPPPRRFRLHLSTALILVFVASGILWLNTRLGTNTVIVKNTHYEHLGYGWPWQFYQTHENAFVRRSNFYIYGTEFESTLFRPILFESELAYDILVALSCLAATGVALEFLIRRRDARYKRSAPL